MRGNMGVILFRRGMFATGMCDKKGENMYWFNTQEIPAKDRDGWTAHGKEKDAIKAEVLERVKEIKIPLVKEIVEQSPDLRFYPIYNLPIGGKWYTQRTILIGDAAHGKITDSFTNSQLCRLTLDRELVWQWRMHSSYSGFCSKIKTYLRSSKNSILSVVLEFSACSTFRENLAT
jgi:hypothetical protein